MTNPTPHGQVPEALIDLIDAYAERRLKAVRVDGWVSRAPDEGMAKRQRKRT